MFGTIEKKIRNRGDEGVEKLIKFVPSMGEKNCLQFGPPIKDNRAWRNTRGNGGGQWVGAVG